MIIHFTTVHPRDDSRIRSKQVASLAQAFGGDVKLYVQDGKGGEFDALHGYEIVDTGPPLKRLSRMLRGAFRMVRAVAAARPAVAHFHDPELLPWAIFLRLWGIKVIYDVHEDMPQQVRHNPGLPPLAQRLLPPFVALAEFIGARLLSGIVVPTKTIGARFPTGKTVLVRNYPILSELHTPSSVPMALRPAEFAYVGYISQVRNIFGMIEAVRHAAKNNEAELSLRLLGSFAVEKCQRDAEATPGWSNVIFQGWASREEVAEALAEVRGGLVVLLPVEHEMVTLPIKLFEYMAAGVPVIASDFPLWRQIVEEAKCGLLVDPREPRAIAGAMTWLLANPDEAERMGCNGRAAVESHYNWDGEAARLISFYSSRLGLSVS